MYQFYFYVPADFLDEVKQAVFAAGAGQVGNYQHCCFQIKGQGEYRPMPGSHAFSGTIDQLSQVIEYKVEMVCDEAARLGVEAALLKAHPYETVAYGFVLLAN